MRGGAAAGEKYLSTLSGQVDAATLAEGERRYKELAATTPAKPSLEPERRPPSEANAGTQAGPAARKQRQATAASESGAQRQASAGGGELVQIQRLLTTFGYDPGPADGQLRAKTTNAIRVFQREAGLTVDGRASSELLDYMKKLAGQ